MITLKSKVGDVHIAASGATRKEAEAHLKASAEAIRKNLPMLGWLARQKGTRGPGRPIVAIDKTPPMRVTLGDKRPTLGLQWADCEYVW